MIDSALHFLANMVTRWGSVPGGGVLARQRIAALNANFPQLLNSKSPRIIAATLTCMTEIGFTLRGQFFPMAGPALTALRASYTRILERIRRKRVLDDLDEDDEVR